MGPVSPGLLGPLFLLSFLAFLGWMQPGGMGKGLREVWVSGRQKHCRSQVSMKVVLGTHRVRGTEVSCGGDKGGRQALDSSARGPKGA